MNKILFMTIIAALLVSGCSDKDDTTSGALEKAMESSKGAMSDMKDKAGEAMDGAKSMASDAADTVGDAASDAMDSASNMASDAADAVGDATDNAMEGAGAMAADAKTAVSESASSAMESASDAGSKAVAAVSGAADGGAAGQQVYKNSCQSCHAAGVAGAPKLGDKDAWAPRIATGIDALVASSINGKGIMPPKGACASCSEEDLKAAVEYMVSQGQ